MATTDHVVRRVLVCRWRWYLRMWQKLVKSTLVLYYGRVGLIYIYPPLLNFKKRKYSSWVTNIINSDSVDLLTTLLAVSNGESLFTKNILILGIFEIAKTQVE